jgi:hypothetical protein
MGNLKYHEKAGHSEQVFSIPFSCEHVGCNLKFKTKKLKLIHHHKIEPECEAEKFYLIKLIRKFKDTMKIIQKKSEFELNSLPAFEDLKNTYNEIQNKIVNPDVFLSVLGNNFDSECDNLNHKEKSEYSPYTCTELSLCKNEEEI